MGCAGISGLATGLWTDLNEPSSLSANFIYNKILSSGFIGAANILTAENNYIEAGCIYPELNSSQMAIYKSLYMYQYYASEGPRIMALSASKGFMTTVKEGDSSISFASPQQIFQTYRGLAQEYKKELDILTDYYKRNEAAPQSVNFYTIDQNGGNSPDEGGR